MNTSNSRLPGELTFILLIVVFSIFMLWTAYSISGLDSLTSPGIFPFACAATMLAAGLTAAFKAVRSNRSPTQGTLLQHTMQMLAPLRLALLAITICLYMLILERLGFLLSSYLFLTASMRLLGSRKIGINMLLSATALIIIYTVFQSAFSVVLPSGSWLTTYFWSN